MHSAAMSFMIFAVFCGIAVLGTIAMYTRQSLIVAYMLLGVLLGPWCLEIIPNSIIVDEIGEIGIVFLLFLLGLHLKPKDLFFLLRKATWITLASSLVFALSGFLVGKLFHYTTIESLVIGASMMFSSTIIGLKLLPTTILHHKHTGDVMVSILLLQDLVAILVLILLKGADGGALSWHELVMIFLSLPLMFVFGSLFVRWILLKLMERFDTTQEYIWILSMAWCMLLVEVAHLLHVSPQIGAFIAGVTLAEHRIAQYIAESFKPMRDLFLVVFFFSVGAHFNPHFFIEVAFPAIILAGVALLIKPVIYHFLLRREGETKSVAWEVGIRLAQNSEFSLLVAYLAGTNVLIGEKTSFLIQAITIITFIVSSYWVVWRYPTPMAMSVKLRRD